MDPETLETFKIVAAIIGAAVGAGIAAWKARGRRDADRGLPVYTGDPDDSPRVITRKEWHLVAGFADAYSRRMPSVRRHLRRLDAEIAEIRGEFKAFGAMAANAATNLARFEERFGAHVEQWEKGAERAQQDRNETNARLDRLERKIDRLPGASAD